MPVGTAIHVTGDNGTSVDVTVKSVAYHSNSGGTSPAAEQPQHGQYTVADVLIVVHAGSYDFNTLDFNYQTQDSTTYDSTSGNAPFSGYEPGLSSGTLHSGQTTRGFVVFDVPKGRGQDIQLTGPGLSGVIGEWKL